MKTKYTRSFCGIIHGSDKNKVAKTRRSRYLGLFFVSCLFINMANAGLFDWLFLKSSPSDTKVPALVCRYMDKVYDAKAIYPVIVFGPKIYNSNSLEQELLNYQPKKGFNVYNNLYTKLQPMQLESNPELFTLLVRGKVIRPHHRHLKVLERETEVIDTSWTLKRLMGCEKLLEGGQLGNKTSEQNKKIIGNPEVWALSREGMHRDLILRCDWDVLNLPKTDRVGAAASGAEAGNGTRESDLPVTFSSEPGYDNLPSNFSVVPNNDPLNNFSVQPRCQLLRQDGVFQNEE